MRLAVLVSGSGTLLAAMCQAQVPIELVVSDRSCRGLHIAEDAGVRSVLLPRNSFDESFDRGAYSDDLAVLLREHEIDVVAMAGFGTILSGSIFNEFSGRIINTHPALLPAFPGWHAVRDALAYGAIVTGCTIHVATPEVDCGPILAQESVRILPDDDEASLHERIKTVERKLYIETLQDILRRGDVLPDPEFDRSPGVPQ